MEPHSSTQNSDDISQIKQDLETLYDHVGGALNKRTEEARVAWIKTQATLESKRQTLEERATELMKSGSAASEDMKNGFSSALAELKKAFIEAKGKFDSE